MYSLPKLIMRRLKILSLFFKQVVPIFDGAKLQGKEVNIIREQLCYGKINVSKF